MVSSAIRAKVLCAAAACMMTFAMTPELSAQPGGGPPSGGGQSGGQQGQGKPQGGQQQQRSPRGNRPGGGGGGGHHDGNDFGKALVPFAIGAAVGAAVSGPPPPPQPYYVAPPPVYAGNSTARIQSQLNRLGYPAGPPDGVMGGGTRSAIRQFQAEHGLAADGVPGYQTQMALNRLAP